MHDESGTVCKVREEPAPCLITAQRLAERDGHVAANPCTFIPLPEAQCLVDDVSAVAHMIAVVRRWTRLEPTRRLLGAQGGQPLS